MQAQMNLRNVQMVLIRFNNWVQTNNGRFTAELLNAITKSLAIAPLDRELTPAYATSYRMRKLLASVQELQFTSATETDRFRGVVVDNEITLHIIGEIDDGPRDDDQIDRDMVNFLAQKLINNGRFNTRTQSNPSKSISQSIQSKALNEGGSRSEESSFLATLVRCDPSPTHLLIEAFDSIDEQLDVDLLYCGVR